MNNEVVEKIEKLIIRIVDKSIEKDAFTLETAFAISSLSEAISLLKGDIYGNDVQ